MGIPLIGLIPKIIKTAGSILGIDSVKDVVDALESNKLSPEQRVALEQATLEYQKEMRALDVEELKALLTEPLAMLSSQDKYVARARPTGLYIFYLASVAVIVAMISGVKIDPTAILTVLGPLAGVGGTYVWKRTQEKMNGNGNGD